MTKARLLRKVARQRELLHSTQDNSLCLGKTRTRGIPSHLRTEEILNTPNHKDSKKRSKTKGFYGVNSWKPKRVSIYNPLEERKYEI